MYILVLRLGVYVRIYVPYEDHPSMNATAKITAYLLKHDRWRAQLKLLTGHLRASELVEDVKWGMPTYTHDGKNVIGLAAFKHHLGVWFHNGAFLDDPHGMLENVQEGKTKGMRHIKYSATDEIDLDILSAYILMAIQNQKDGKVIKTKPSTPKPLEIPDMMIDVLGGEAIAMLKTLTTGKRNEYITYICSAKREATQLSRLEKIKPLILAGQGINDAYRK